jgi:prepilin-type N-terminal cleavage/methylation domain-containing protein
VYIIAMFKEIQRRFHGLKRHQGFSLLELSIVVSVVALMIVAILPIFTQDQLKRREQELNFRLNQIEQAMLLFVQQNNRLPCPAIRGYATGHASFGVEAATPGTCTSTYTTGSNGRLGAVPTRTLGLPDDYAFDPWDRAITYVVDLRATGARAFNYTYPVTDSAHGAAQGTSIGALTVKDVVWSSATASDRTTSGILVLISHGPNGHGGYPRTAGTSTALTRWNAGVTNTYELANCNCSAAVADSASLTFYAAIPAPNIGALTNSYDDRVRYYTRGFFTTKAERVSP